MKFSMSERLAKYQSSSANSCLQSDSTNAGFDELWRHQTLDFCRKTNVFKILQNFQIEQTVLWFKSENADFAWTTSMTSAIFWVVLERFSSNLTSKAYYECWSSLTWCDRAIVYWWLAIIPTLWVGLIFFAISSVRYCNRSNKQIFWVSQGFVTEKLIRKSRSFGNTSLARIFN